MSLGAGLLLWYCTAAGLRSSAGALTLSELLLGVVLLTLVAFLRVDVVEDLPGLAADLLRSVVTVELRELELLLVVLSEPLTAEELLELRLVVTVELREPEVDLEPVVPL